MSQFKRGDRVFIMATVVHDGSDDDDDIYLETMGHGVTLRRYVDPAIVHASLPGNPDRSIDDRTLLAWRSWMNEAIMCEHEGQSAIGCVGIAREIRDGAAAGFTLDTSEDDTADDAFRRRHARVWGAADDLLRALATSTGVRAAEHVLRDAMYGGES